MSFRIVILDDEPAICEIFKDAFEAPDIQITTFTNPSEAINFVNAEHPDLIFVDFRLPGTTGDKVAGAMPGSIPKVLITGELGVMDFPVFYEVVRKPFKMSRILEIIDHFRPGLKMAE